MARREMSTRPSGFASETVIRPSRIRRDAPRESDAAAKQALAIRIRTAMLSARLALEIQARCGMVPLSSHREKTMKGYRDLAAKWCGDRLPEDVEALLQGSYDELLDKMPCSHCEARETCPAMNTKRLN